MTRIVELVPELLPCPPVLDGGLERLVADYSVGLASRGHDVHIITPRAPLWPATAMRWGDVTVHPIPGGDAYAAAALPLVNGLRPDVVHVHNRPDWVSAIDAPALLSLHNPPAGWSSEAPAAGLMRAARVLAVSSWLAGLVSDRFDVDATVVRGHVELETFTPLPPGSVPTARTVLFAGKLDPRKGLDVLLGALDAPALADWRLIVCSPIPPVTGLEAWQADVLERMTADSRIKVLLPPLSRAGIADVFRGVAVVAVPSVADEALGLVGAEAQACGRPAVVTDSGGLRETIDDGRTGYVVPRGEAGPLAAAIAAAGRGDLVGDPRTHAEANFALDNSLDTIELLATGTVTIGP